MNDIDNFMKKFTDEKINYTKKGKKYFLISPELQEIEKKLPETISSGIILGESVDKGNFRPSIYLLEWLTPRTKNKLFVNDKAEWLFLCERDALPESITKDNSTNDIFLVQNMIDENLGLGKKIRKGKTMFVKNIFDRGNFLRREREK
jgi:ribosome biogenesis protein Nip4